MACFSGQLNRALGGRGEPDWIPDRPKGMRQRTCERLAAKLEHYASEADAIHGMEIAPQLARLGMPLKR